MKQLIVHVSITEVDDDGEVRNAFEEMEYVEPAMLATINKRPRMAYIINIAAKKAADRVLQAYVASKLPEEVLDAPTPFDVPVASPDVDIQTQFPPLRPDVP